jgi:hypothetical protein
MTEIMTGGCRCGACRYTLTVEAMPPVYCCHCTDCQTWSGSAFTEQAVVRPETIAASGPVVEFSLTAPSGAISTQHACETCGTRLWNTNSKRPGLAAVRAGTFDASTMIVPRAHIWTNSKQSWIAIPDGIPSWPENAPLADFVTALQTEI